jgi:hypothetical protein
MAKGKIPAGLAKFMANKRKGSGGKKSPFGGKKAAPFKKKGK